MLAASVLLGCGQEKSPRAMLEDYASRVEYVLETQPVRPAGPPLVSYPSHRERRLEIEEVRVDLLDAFALRKCGLLTLISERNSITGKVMPASQRLIYEVRFLTALRECPDRLLSLGDDDGELLQLVRTTIASKERDLKKVFWAATFDGPEMQKVFSLANEPITQDEHAPYLASRQALETLLIMGRQLGAKQEMPDSEGLETQLRTLSINEFGGRIAHAQQLLQQELTRVALALETVVAKRPFCFAGKPNQRARILKTVFEKFYAGGIQLYLSQVYQQSRGWQDTLSALLAQQPRNRTAEFDEYWNRMWSPMAPDGLWAFFEASIARHTAAWQTILRQCSLVPGAEAR